MSAHETNEALRKFLHIGMGFGALALTRIPWRYAALICAAAVIGNWLLLHRIVGRRVSRHERGWDVGIVLYPFAVLVLIVVFNWHIEIAAVAWVLLAFGDGFATRDRQAHAAGAAAVERDEVVGRIRGVHPLRRHRGVRHRARVRRAA